MLSAVLASPLLDDLLLLGLLSFIAAGDLVPLSCTDRDLDPFLSRLSDSLLSLPHALLRISDLPVPGSLRLLASFLREICDSGLLLSAYL